MLKHKPIVVTGVSSFVGYHLAKYFSNQGLPVIGTISRSIEHYDDIRLQRLKDLKGTKLEVVDLCHRKMVEHFIESVKPVFWFHHAGFAKDYGSFEFDMDRGYDVNVRPLEWIYPALKKVEVQGVIVTGTGAEYSDSDDAHKEDEVCLPVTPYGLSKLVETQRAAQLANLHKLKTRVARIFIPYGSMDHPQKLFATVIQSLRNGKKIELSPCEQERDFLFIDDLMSGYQGLMKHIESSEQIFEIFNLCSGEATQVKRVLLAMAKDLKVSASLLDFGSKTMRPGEAMRQYGSNQKAKLQLNWQPKSIEQGVKLFLKE